MELIIGTKRLSSWSLRAWLPLKQTGQPFTETEIELYPEARQPRILDHSPSGYVPALKDGDLVVADSLAIGEYRLAVSLAYNCEPDELIEAAAEAGVAAPDLFDWITIAGTGLKGAPSFEIDYECA